MGVEKKEKVVVFATVITASGEDWGGPPITVGIYCCVIDQDDDVWAEIIVEDNRWYCWDSRSVSYARYYEALFGLFQMGDKVRD